MPLNTTKNKFAPSAAIADLGTAGTSTVAQIEAKVNAILAALRAAGIIDS